VAKNKKNTELYFKYSKSKYELKKTMKNVTFQLDITKVPNQQHNNECVSTCISAIYGGQNALQERLCERVRMDRLLLQDREESGTACDR
jgi:Tfp pilus assembly protein PilE